MTDNEQSVLNLLVVDDDPAILRLVTTFLNADLGDRVEIVGMSAPSAAKDWLSENRCDILISDIEMPGIDGLEMLRYAKQMNAWTQVVFMTGHSKWGHITEAVENGASDYLLKPIDRAELTTLIRQTCDRCTRWQTAVYGAIHAELGV